MTDLTQMWTELARYQPFADADGHGNSWRVMCEKRTEAAADAAAVAAAAYEAVPAAGAAYEAAYAAALEAARALAARALAARAARAAEWSDRSITRIEAAIKERT